MVTDQENEIEHIRRMAAGLDCLLEDDFRLLAGATRLTVEAWRKRGQDPTGQSGLVSPRGCGGLSEVDHA